MIYYKEIRCPSHIPPIPDEVKEEEEMLEVINPVDGRSTPTGAAAIRAATPNPPPKTTPNQLQPTELTTTEMAIEPSIILCSDMLRPTLPRLSSPASVASGSGTPKPRVGPKVEGNKGPLSVKAKREKRKIERANRKGKRDAALGTKRGNIPNTNNLGELKAGDSFEKPEDKPQKLPSDPPEKFMVKWIPDSLSL